MKKALLAIVYVSFFLFCRSQPLLPEAPDRPVLAAAPGNIAVILDTDIGPDYDDVGAVAILYAMASKGEVKILATVASNKYEGIAGVLNVLNTYFKHPEMPIGVPKGNAVDAKDSQHWTDSILARYPHRILRNDEVPDAITMYRKILAAQPDHSVTIITTGFLTNMANLLQSPADGFSPLDGRQLVLQKVKLMVTMGGAFPSGSEYNLRVDAKASGIALSEWPTPVIFSGYEIGMKIKTGLPLIGREDLHGPTKDVFRISIPKSPDDAKGRMSWDETAVLVAIRTPDPYFTLQPGRIIMHPDGTNGWDATAKGQYYLVFKTPPKVVEDVINELMLFQPAGNYPK